MQSNISINPGTGLGETYAEPQNHSTGQATQKHVEISKQVSILSTKEKINKDAGEWPKKP